MRRVARVCVIATAVLAVLAPLPARADGFVSPWFGSVFARSEDLRGVDNGSTSFGVGLGAMGSGGIFGFDIDFGFTPTFLGSKTDFGSNRLITFSADLLAGAPIESSGGKGVRPYAVFGVGLIRTQAEGGALLKNEFAENDFGWNAGAGLMGFFSSKVGLRGDVRYFHTVNNSSAENTILLKPGSFHYWRGYIGVIFR